MRERIVYLYDDPVDRVKLMMQEKEEAISGAVVLIRKGGGYPVHKLEGQALDTHILYLR